MISILKLILLPFYLVWTIFWGIVSIAAGLAVIIIPVWIFFAVVRAGTN